MEIYEAVKLTVGGYSHPIHLPRSVPTIQQALTNLPVRLNAWSNGESIVCIKQSPANNLTELSMPA